MESVCVKFFFRMVSDPDERRTHGWKDRADACHDDVYGNISYPKVYRVKLGRMQSEKNVGPYSSTPALSTDTEVI